MTRYLISFDDGAMTFPRRISPPWPRQRTRWCERQRMPALGSFGGGLHSYEQVSVVATNGTVTDGPYPESKAYIGGFSVVDVPSREEALDWAGRIAVACRCAQEVREFVPGSTP
jgi:hypothetical protein